MPQLEIRLFGAPTITIAGALLEVDTRKAIALLAYLAVTKQRYTRDALAALLWPDYNQTEAKGALRRTLSVLNKGLGGDWLDADREAIELLHRPYVWIDVETFGSVTDITKRLSITTSPIFTMRPASRSSRWRI